MSLRDLASEVGETNLQMPTGQDNVGVVRVCVSIILEQIDNDINKWAARSCEWFCHFL